MSDRAQLLELYAAALAAVDPGRAVRRGLASELREAGSVRLLAVGKAACGMARAAQEELGPRLRGGAVCTAGGLAAPISGLAVREAGHPLPDERSIAAACEALRVASTLAPDELLLVLLSGGASALWCAPAGELSLDDKRATAGALLGCGADIEEINAVRKHLSQIKGGQLARAAGPQRVFALAISDVHGDRPDVIGSGPTAPDPTSYADALAVLRRHDLLSRIPRRVRAHLEQGAAGRRPETPDAVELGAVGFQVVARLADALGAVTSAARERGLRVVDLGARLYGDVEQVALDLAAQVRGLGDGLIVAGGEPAVRVRGPGRGGRCQELALRLLLGLAGEPGWTALCAATDGADGSSDVAGAVVDAGTLSRARGRGIDVRAALGRSDSRAALEASGDLLRTGPTGTNVADLVLIRVRR